MSKFKLTPRHYILLAIAVRICRRSTFAVFDCGDGRIGMWCDELHQHTVVSGSDGARLKALARHGYLVHMTRVEHLRYAFAVTELGSKTHAEWVKTLPKSRKRLEEYLRKSYGPISRTKEERR